MRYINLNWEAITPKKILEPLLANSLWKPNTRHAPTFLKKSIMNKCICGAKHSKTKRKKSLLGPMMKNSPNQLTI